MDLKDFAEGATQSLRITIEMEAYLMEDENRAITRGLMRLSERSLARILENEHDICMLEDLKIIF
jgi:hypothetical protein